MYIIVYINKTEPLNWIILRFPEDKEHGPIYKVSVLQGVTSLG